MRMTYRGTADHCHLPLLDSINIDSLNNPATRRSQWRPRYERSGFTLLEILVATAITLLMMLSLVQVFKVIGDSMKQGRAALQMNNTLRAISTRIRHDLGNLTVRVDPPSDTSSGGGYFEFFEGSITDYTAALYGNASRYGDADDMLMFTSRAGDSWFTGQVPAKVLQVAPMPLPAGDAPVVITSQLAEIVVFPRPINTVMAGQPTRLFDDFDTNGFPDGFQLHYRVLLIRPDLNISTVTNTLPNLSLAGTASGYTPTAMAPLFQQCDLSMRRVYSLSTSVPIVDYVAANSLEDLADPHNRFAHFQYQLPGTASSCSMPLLVLEPLPSQPNVPNATTPVMTVLNGGLYPDPNPDIAGPLRHAFGNFLDPSFVLGGIRTGEDVLATNVLAFDIKGYDVGVPIIAVQGGDGGFGVYNPLTSSFSGIEGQDGTDDLVLSPNDPGYATAFATTTPSIVSYGEYVDLMWGRKCISSLTAPASTTSAATSFDYTNIYPRSPNLYSGLSGLTGTLPNTAVPVLPTFYTDGLRRSGKSLRHTSAPTYSILQPTYDTWTTMYESNGTRQGQLAGFEGVADVNAMARKIGGFGSGDTLAGVTDGGTDGLDNNGSGGADEPAERETLAPFPTRLRGVKISIRMEDRATRQVKQMSIAQDFASQ